MILIRADANALVGSGHVMRCLSIARALRSLGEETLFATADRDADALLGPGGFARVCLESDWTDMEAELPALRALVARERPRLLLVDSYRVTGGYLGALSSLGRTAYIDDLNAARWDVDILVNYNVTASPEGYASRYEGARTRLLLGPRYAPLRDEFRGLPERAVAGDAREVLVSAGGSDPERVSERILREICPERPGLLFHFVVGALNGRVDELRRLARACGNVEVHVNERRMADLMRRCDIAVSAAGSTLYELCACGTPAVAYVLADNQAPAAERFAREGVMLFAGDCRDGAPFLARLGRALDGLCGSAALRGELSRRMRSLVDGGGAPRLAAALLGLEPENGCGPAEEHTHTLENRG